MRFLNKARGWIKKAMDWIKKNEKALGVLIKLLEIIFRLF